MTATQARWFSALAPYVERDDLVVELANPFLTPTGERVDSVPSVFVRFPMWRGEPFVDDLGKKTAAMIELDGEHLFAELAEKAATRPAGSRTVTELDAGVHAIGKKIVEEAAEVWMAAEFQTRDDAALEISQLIYHLQVLMLALDLEPDDIYAKL